MSEATREQLRQIFRDQGWTEKDAEKIYSAISAIEKWHNSALEAQAQAHAEEVVALKNELALEISHSKHTEEEVTRLKLREAALVKALTDVEWSMSESAFGSYCPECGGHDPNHIKNCSLASALASTAPDAGELRERLANMVLGECPLNMEEAYSLVDRLLSVAGGTA